MISRLSNGMTWRQTIDAFAAAPHVPPSGELFEWFRIHYADLTNDDFKYLADCLHDKKRALLVGRLLADKAIPESLFEPLILAAIYETDLNNVRVFIEPCGLTFGYRIVCEWLMAFVESGSDYEKAGAVRALYWSNPNAAQERHPERACDLAEEAKQIRPLRRKIRWRLMREFIRNDDLDVRRSIMSQLNLHYWGSPLRYWPRIFRARRVAQLHEDVYARDRYRLAAGRDGPFFSAADRVVPGR